MATQQVLFAETIAGMKKAFKRKAYESDSDSEIEIGHNRGRKLKRTGRFAHKGQLVPSSGPNAYKEAVDYAGVRRSILYRNPPLVDEEGYEIDSDVDDEGRIREAMEAAAELNPYADVHIERVLAPLTASTDLSRHPTLSKHFTSRTLTELCLESAQIMRKENQSLWQVRHLWTSLCGDGVWMPCETMVGSKDAELYSEDHVARHLLSLSQAQQPKPEDAQVNGQLSEGHHTETRATLDGTLPNGDAYMGSAGAAKDTEKALNSRQQEDATGEGTVHHQNRNEEFADVDMKDGVVQKSPKGREEDANRNEPTTQKLPEADPRPGDSAATENRAADNFVHPMFIAPDKATVDRNMGLPMEEAEDIRRLLALYIQKQEEICRGARRLHQGLLKADQLRRDVLHWSKAEMHCGPNRDLSDGEDWYDKEEWGLTEDLKKGQDDEEEVITTTGKKTRARRN